VATLIIVAAVLFSKRKQIAMGDEPGPGDTGPRGTGTASTDAESETVKA
jgi:hypothetical protein